jgi:hypothetical protein
MPYTDLQHLSATEFKRLLEVGDFQVRSTIAILFELWKIQAQLLLKIAVAFKD